MLRHSLTLFLLTILNTWLGLEKAPGQDLGPRYGHDLAYDEQRNLVILFGGFHNDGQPLSDTWSWDGRRWHRFAPGGPSSRKWPAIVYDARRGHIVFFGGRTGVGQTGSSLSDTWMWDGQVWKRLTGAGPLKRGIYALVYDRVDHHALFYGSGIRKEGRWILDAESWIWEDNAWHMVR